MLNSLPKAKWIYAITLKSERVCMCVSVCVCISVCDVWLVKTISQDVNDEYFSYCAYGLPYCEIVSITFGGSQRSCEMASVHKPKTLL